MGADQQSMKLRAAIADYQTEIQLREDGGRVFADLGGRAYKFDAHESADGFLLTHNGQVFNCRIEGRPESGKAIEVIVGTTHFVLTVTDPKRLSTAASASVHGDDAARIVAPMPGKVVRVMVEAGAKVAAGDGIIVVEAMKMQNEIRSPKAGTVIALNTQEGVTVNGGDVLAIIE
jgi:acetyl/propionyl-CoA carboxylase alpha subunit